MKRDHFLTTATLAADLIAPTSCTGAKKKKMKIQI
jgi:hypothetical protein